MRQPNHLKRAFHSMSSTVKNGARAVRILSGTTAVLAGGVLLASLFFSSVASAACNPRGKSPVLVSNWTKFLKDGLSAGAPPAAGQGSDPSIVGMWHVFMVAGGQPFDEGYDVWHSDGTEIFNDVAPPQAANGSGAVCFGVYEKSGPGTYRLRHIGWVIDENANLAGSIVVTQTVTMDAGGGSYHGSFDFKLYDLSQNVVFETTGTISATRVRVSG
jgi:hypothetical protein